MESMGKILSSDIEEMKKLVREKSRQLLAELTKDNFTFFIKEASIMAESVMENYIFSVYDLFASGELAIKDLTKMEAFTNPITGYQKKMLEWKEQNEPDVHLSEFIPMPPQEPSGKPWHYVTLGVGTVGAIGLAIGRCHWAGLAVELLTFAVSYYLFKEEKNGKQKYEEQLKKYESELDKKRDLFVNEVILSLEAWLKQGESYSKELLATYNL